MLATLTTKVIADRWRGMTVGAVAMGLMLLAGMAAYGSMDLSVYTSLPEVFLEMVGIDADVDAAGLAYAGVYGTYGTIVLAGLGISMGSASIAGEERDGTVGLLLANPRSRTQVLRAKALALTFLLSVVGVALWLMALAAPALLGVDVADRHVAALVLHMTAGALLHGFLALLVGAWTGVVGRAVGIATGVLVLSFFAVGILPLFDRVADAVRLFPWYYVTGADPLRNGASVGHLAVLLLGTGGLWSLAEVGVRRRDLRQPTAGERLLDAVLAHPTVARLVERLAGGARVSRIWVKTATEHQGLTVVTAVIMFAMMGLLMGPLYAAIDDTLALTAELPEAILAIAGGGDMSTPEGWYQLETYGLMAPISVMVVTITVGARGLAGEEARRTMGLLLANPVPRWRVVVEKALAMSVLAVVVGIATFAGVAGGSAIAGLGMDLSRIAAASTLQVLIGLLFGGVALAVGAGTGRARTATMATIGLALAAYLLNTFGLLTERLADLARWSPFQWATGGEPLLNGMDWAAGGRFLVLFGVLVALAARLFDARDLRNG